MITITPYQIMKTAAGILNKRICRNRQAHHKRHVAQKASESTRRHTSQDVSEGLCKDEEQFTIPGYEGNSRCFSGAQDCTLQRTRPRTPRFRDGIYTLHRCISKSGGWGVVSDRGGRQRAPYTFYISQSDGRGNPIFGHGIGFTEFPILTKEAKRQNFLRGNLQNLRNSGIPGLGKPYVSRSKRNKVLDTGIWSITLEKLVLVIDGKCIKWSTQNS